MSDKEYIEKTNKILSAIHTWIVINYGELEGAKPSYNIWELSQYLAKVL